MTLTELEIGQCAAVTAVGGEGALRQHFLDMGVIPGARVTLVKYAPMGDPMELMIQGYELTLRLADAQKIEITPVPAQEAKDSFKTEKQKPTPTRAWVKGANTIQRAAAIPCPRIPPSPLPWWAIRTAARPPCSTSSPAPISTWVISPG